MLRQQHSNTAQTALIPASVEAKRIRNCWRVLTAEFGLFFNYFIVVLSLLGPKIIHAQRCSYMQRMKHSLCGCRSCSSRREVLPFPWWDEVTVHQKLEENPILAKIWSHSEGLPTQWVCCCLLDHSNRLSPRVSLIKKYLPTPEMVSGVCRFWADYKISKKKVELLHDFLSERK